MQRDKVFRDKGLGGYTWNESRRGFLADGAFALWIPVYLSGFWRRENTSCLGVVRPDSERILFSFSLSVAISLSLSAALRRGGGV